MKTRTILCAAILGIVVFAFSTESFGATVESSGIVKTEPNMPIENRDEYTALINGKEIHLSKELKLSEVFNTLGDPEDIEQGNYGLVLYCWGLGNESRQSIIIEAQPKTSEVTDWMVIDYGNEKTINATAYSIAGKSRYRLAEELNYMRKAREAGKSLCTEGIWCELYDRTQNNDNVQPYEVLDKHSVVGPKIDIGIHNYGINEKKLTENFLQDICLHIVTPDGKEHISNRSSVKYLKSKLFDIGDLFQANIPFFAWVADSNETVDVPTGTYRYYATFLGAKSRTQECEVYNKTLVITSPNSEDEEIFITPYFDKLPIHRLNYEQLIQECRSVFKDRFEGEPKSIAISAYESIDRLVRLSGGGHGHGVTYSPRKYPLSDFAEVIIRKKTTN